MEGKGGGWGSKGDVYRHGRSDHTEELNKSNIFVDMYLCFMLWSGIMCFPLNLSPFT